MLKLNTHLTLDEDTIKAPNLCDKFDEQDLQAIAAWVFEGYSADKQSRHNWEKRTESAMDLAMQLQKVKSFPWANCSNIKFPLVTIGAMQFHAKSYPAIIQGTDVVKMRVTGEDPDGIAHQRALRIGEHMSYQVLEEDQPWEEQHDRLLLILAIIGSVFIKTFYSPKLRHNVSELVLAKDLVLDYWAKSVDDCARKTHRIPLSRNSIRERVLSGVYKDVLEDHWYQEPARPQATTQEIRADHRTGSQPNFQPDEITPFSGLEMHCLLDLDGDGYAEPYIIVLEETSKTVLRIVSRVARPEDIERVPSGPYKDEIISIRAEEYFTKYSFIPSPDGGIYDVGFGILLGPLNESVDSLINQLVDAGTISNTAGGFIGRGAKIRGGVYNFSPFEWNRVDSTGEDLKKSIFPLPVREPSNVLFQLLGLLINYTNRISGATDAITGENPGQNTPAQTQQSMIEMGMKIYNAIFKRIWRSMKEEFRKLYILNGLNLPAYVDFGSGDNKVSREDYLGDPNRVVPVADPNVTSDGQRLQRAVLLKQTAMTTPGYDWEVVERRFLKAAQIDDIDAVYPGPKSPKATPIPNPKAAVEQIKQQGKQLEIEAEKAMLAAELVETHHLNEAKILELQAKAEKALQESHGVETTQRINMLNATTGALKAKNDAILKHIELLLGAKELEQDAKQTKQAGNKS
jgi:chaperonin GroES